MHTFSSVLRVLPSPPLRLFAYCFLLHLPASALRVEVVAYGILPSTDSRLAAISVMGSASSGNSTGASGTGTTNSSAGAVVAEAVADIVAVTTLPLPW